MSVEQAHLRALEPTCGECGYSLLGLEASGRCPECGCAFGPDQLVLWGTEGGPFKADRIARNLQLAWAVLVAGAFVLLLWRRLASFRLESIAMFAPAMAWLGMVAWMLWVGKRRRQVRLSAHGFGVRLGPGPVKVQPWRGDEEIDLRRARAHAYVLTIRQNLAVPVQMNVACSDEELESLRRRIEEVIGRKVGVER